MRRDLLYLLVLAAAPAAAQADPGPPLPPPPPVYEMPPHYICSVSREMPLGTIGAQQSVSPAGVADAPLFTWSWHVSTGGIALDASWSRAPSTYSLIQVSYVRAETGRSYRFRVHRRSSAPGETQLTLEAALMPSEDGPAYSWAEWGPLTAALTDAEDPRFLVLDDTGAEVANERLDVATFHRARAAAEALRPELRPLVANYRRHCIFYDGGPIAPPQTPVP